MALRRSSRSTTVAAAQKSAIDAADRRRKLADRQARLASNHASTEATLQPSLVQPTQPTQPTQPVGLLPEVQAVTSGKRRRDDGDSQTGPRKKKTAGSNVTASWSYYTPKR